MIDTQNQSGQFRALTSEFFSNLQDQEDDQDKFTAVRRSVISFVERVPQKSCDSGWTYDHSLVFNTITSEVSIMVGGFIIATSMPISRPILKKKFWIKVCSGSWGSTVNGLAPINLEGLIYIEYEY